MFSDSSATKTGKLLRPHWLPLDGLRGLAILMVVTVHFWAHSSSDGRGFPVILSADTYQFSLDWVFRAGAMGVPVFFVLSGFLLWYPSAKAIAEGNSLTRPAPFLMRRMRRILPAFIFFTVIYLLLIIAFGKTRHCAPTTTVNLLSNLFFIAPIVHPFLGQEVSLGVMPGTWSLTPEMWFYALLAALLLFYSVSRSMHWPLIAIFLVTGPIYRRIVLTDTDFIVHFNILGCIHSFAWGMLAANMIVRQPRALCYPLLGYAGLFLLIASAWWHRMLFDCIDSDTQASVAAALILVSVVSCESLLRSFLEAPLLRFIGKISYSLFLCHIFVAWYIFGILWDVAAIASGSPRFAILITAGTVVSGAIASAGYEWVERPWLEAQLNRRRLSRAVWATLGAAASLSLLAAFSAVWEYHALGSLKSFPNSPVLRLSASLRKLDRQTVWSLAPGEQINIDFDLSSTIKPVLSREGNTVRLIVPDGFAGKWIALKANGAARRMRPHQPHTMRAICQSSHDFGILQLGFYDGRDTGSLPVPFASRQELEFDFTPRSGNDDLQLKINVFPHPNHGAFEVIIPDWEIFTY